MSTMTKKTQKKPTPIFQAKKVSNSAAELTIYAPIEDEESFWYDSVSPKGVIRSLKSMGDVDEIFIRINSPGGSVFAGLAIYQYLKDHKAKVTAKVDGLAASAASIILMAADYIIMGTGAMVMAHNPWMVAMGEAKDFREAADVLDKIQTSLISVYEDRTGKTGDELKAMMDATTWLTADEAVAMGFADEVDRKTKVKASIKNGIATFGSQRFDLRAFASIPPLPEEDPEDEPDLIDPEQEQPAPESAEGVDTVKDLAELQAKHPDIFQAAITKGAEQERTRINDLNALAGAPGAAGIVAKAIMEGGTAATAAIEIVKASTERLSVEGRRRATDSQNSGAGAVPSDEAPENKLNPQAAYDIEADAILAEIQKMMGGKK